MAAILLRSRASPFCTGRMRAHAPALHRSSAAASPPLHTPTDSSQSQPARATSMLSSSDLGVISAHPMRHSLVLSTLGAKYCTVVFDGERNHHVYRNH